LEALRTCKFVALMLNILPSGTLTGHRSVLRFMLPEMTPTIPFISGLDTSPCNRTRLPLTKSKSWPAISPRAKEIALSISLAVTAPGAAGFAFLLGGSAHPEKNAHVRFSRTDAHEDKAGHS